jgi:toxin HigB-1
VCSIGIAVAGVRWLTVRAVTGLWRAATAVVIIACVIRSFADTATADLFNGVDSVRARRACPSTLWAVVARKLTQLNRVRELRELAVPPNNRLKALQGDRKGQHSIRINDQFRICFIWEDGYADDVEVTDYH